MYSIPSAVKAGLCGAVGGASAAVLLVLLVVLLARTTGGYVVVVPDHLEASGGATNGAASLEFTVTWSTLTVAAAVGALIELRRAGRRTRDAGACPR